MILRFRVKIGYNGPYNIFILFKNRISAMRDLFIINNKLDKNIRPHQAVPIPCISRFLFISSLIGFVPKHDKGFQYIHHLF